MHCTITLFDANDESLHTHMLSFTCLKECMCFNMLPKFLYSPSLNFPLFIRCFIVVENTNKETLSAQNFVQKVTEVKDVALDQCINAEIVPVQNSSRELVTETRSDDNTPLECLQELSVNLKNLLDQAVGTDITIHVDGVSMKAHKMILRARSPVFEKMFGHDTSEAVQNEIDIKDIRAPMMKEFLTFLYTGAIENHDFDDACDLYYAADKYEVLSLRNACKKDLLRHLQVDNACQLLSLATNHGEESLKKEILEFIKNNFKAIVLTKSFEELAKYDANLVVLLMRNHMLYKSE
nr:speckle-type POZ protein B-like [Parasteatoda tepidariorum]